MKLYVKKSEKKNFQKLFELNQENLKKKKFYTWKIKILMQKLLKKLKKKLNH